ncbi:MAG: HAD family hydrolase [Chloroflexota bacterium]
MTISPNGIRAILFDLDGTLRHYRPSGADEFNRFAMSLGVSLHPEDIIRTSRWEHYYFAGSPEIRADNEAFKDEGQFWVNFARRRLVALGCSPAQAADLAPRVHVHMRENHKPTIHVPDDARALVALLKESGYVLGVVSNRENQFENHMEEMGFGGQFHFTLAGGEVNSYKPESGIFEEALRRAGTSAPETMYVGDNYFADVIGSLRAGLRPVLYDPSGLFPEAGCPVIQSFDQLTALL